MPKAPGTAASQDMSHLIRFIPAFRELEEADLDALGKALRERAVKETASENGSSGKSKKQSAVTTEERTGSKNSR